MKDKKRIIILAIAVVVIILIMITALIISLQGEKKKSTNQEAVDKVSTDIDHIVGGVLYGDGYSITQVVDKDRDTVFNIQVNALPFNENADKALQWLRDQGLDLKNTKYQCFESIYIKATDQEKERCTHLSN